MNNALIHITEGWNALVLQAVLLSALPFMVFLFLILFGRIINKFRGIFATVVMFICLLIAGNLFAEVLQTGGMGARLEWFQIGKQTFAFNIYIDYFASLMLLVVSIIAFLVHLFSIEYLRGDKDFEKYFAYLGLFVFSMFWILMTDNLFITFIFWELVGFSSYLLIGFWYTKESAIYANKKAFLVNKVGDTGFLLGILLLWANVGTVNYSELYFLDLAQAVGPTWIIVAGFGLVLAALSKSAQFPLHVWLPNAMEGPTPVSALIHAATMVAAGIYLLARIYPILDPAVLDTVAYLGAITVLLGALSACVQYDIKLVLAYSTISQLGYMVMAMGVRAYEESVFHLLTHACFKACLFLSAGAIIHSMYTMKKKLKKQGVDVKLDAQDMRNMGGLRKHHPVTFVAFLVSGLALMGVPFTAGFLSKDGILMAVWAYASKHGGATYLLPFIGLSGVVVTAYYMTRQLLLVFGGSVRSLKRLSLPEEGLLENTPWLMRIPNIVLTVLSLFVVFSVNPFDGRSGWVMKKLQTIIPHAVYQNFGDIHLQVSVASTVCLLLGVALGYYYFGTEEKRTSHIAHSYSSKSAVFALLEQNFYINELYQTLFVKTTLLLATISAFVDEYVVNKLVEVQAALQRKLAVGVARFDTQLLDRGMVQFGRLNVIFAHVSGYNDRMLVDGLVVFSTKVAATVGNVARRFQNGNVQSYIITAAVFLGVLLYIVII